MVQRQCAGEKLAKKGRNSRKRIAVGKMHVLGRGLIRDRGEGEVSSTQRRQGHPGNPLAS